MAEERGGLIERGEEGRGEGTREKGTEGKGRKVGDGFVDMGLGLGYKGHALQP